MIKTKVFPFLFLAILASTLGGAVPHLRQEDGGHEEDEKDEKVTGVDQPRLQLVTESGKCMLEGKQTLKTIRHGKAKLVILTAQL